MIRHGPSCRGELSETVLPPLEAGELTRLQVSGEDPRNGPEGQFNIAVQAAREENQPGWLADPDGQDQNFVFPPVETEIVQFAGRRKSPRRDELGRAFCFERLASLLDAGQCSGQDESAVRPPGINPALKIEPDSGGVQHRVHDVAVGLIGPQLSEKPKRGVQASGQRLARRELTIHLQVGLEDPSCQRARLLDRPYGGRARFIRGDALRSDQAPDDLPDSPQRKDAERRTPDLPDADFSRPQGLQYFLGHLRFFHPLREVTRRGMTYGVQPEVKDLERHAGLLLDHLEQRQACGGECQVIDHRTKRQREAGLGNAGLVQGGSHAASAGRQSVKCSSHVVCSTNTTRFRLTLASGIGGLRQTAGLNHTIVYFGVVFSKFPPREEVISTMMFIARSISCSVL